MRASVVFACVSALLASLASRTDAQAPGKLTGHLSIVGSTKAPVPVVVEVQVDDEGKLKTIERVETTVPGTFVVSLPKGTAWTVRAVARGFWNLPATFKNGERPAPLRMKLWRATTVKGILAVPKGVPHPHAIGLRLQSHVQSGAGHLAPTTLVCPVEPEGYFACAVPRLPNADLRFRVPGFASRFFWDVNLDSNKKHDVGRLRLRPGASVVGRVALESRADPRDVSLELLPTRQSPFTPLSKEQAGERVAESRPDASGFFSFEGLDRGVYRLVAQHPELAPVELAPIRVIEGGQTEIEEPLVLSPALPLRLSLEPLFDPEKADWRVRIFSGSDRSSGSPPVVEATATAGYLVTQGIPLGAYEIDVLDSHGELLATHDIVHSEDGGLQILEVTTIRVEGTVTLGDEPLLARLNFSKLATDLEVESDFDGRFHLYLPDEGKWDVQISARIPVVEWRRTDVEVQAKDGIAELDLVLPDTLLSGVVVDESGQPHGAAMVEVAEIAITGSAVRLQSDSNGRFAFRGLNEDRYQIAATVRKEDLSSEPEAVTLVEGSDPEIRLVLQEKRSLEGRIIDFAGNPLPNTWIEPQAYTAAGTPDALTDLARSTDSRGDLRLSLRASTASVLLSVFAPGFAARSVVLEPGNVGDILVRPEGGTIVLELPAAQQWNPPRWPLPIVITPSGQKISVGVLVQWARLNGVTNDPMSTRFTFPMLEAGPYRVCWVRADDFGNRFTVGRGCVGGQLRVGGTLSLALGAASPSVVHSSG